MWHASGDVCREASCALRLDVRYAILQPVALGASVSHVHSMHVAVTSDAGLRGDGRVSGGDADDTMRGE